MAGKKKKPNSVNQHRSLFKGGASAGKDKMSGAMNWSVAFLQNLGQSDSASSFSTACLKIGFFSITLVFSVAFVLAYDVQTNGSFHEAANNKYYQQYCINASVQAPIKHFLRNGLIALLMSVHFLLQKALHDDKKTSYHLKAVEAEFIKDAQGYFSAKDVSNEKLKKLLDKMEVVAEYMEALENPTLFWDVIEKLVAIIMSAATFAAFQLLPIPYEKYFYCKLHLTQYGSDSIIELPFNAPNSLAYGLIQAGMTYGIIIFMILDAFSFISIIYRSHEFKKASTLYTLLLKILESEDDKLTTLIGATMKMKA